ncbi:LamG domain-containing protein [Candidatus Parabeggiatoa sp. HSG14]|uniref:LamG domain-containing protein n=1 Tax=Candidatus Parabeggiatoa sp. HSG14 TaxID=3055593 RepID=UPI0025A8139A|nr:LamG domain-containing protein [Thiotrichales bacterium HSG14]
MLKKLLSICLLMPTLVMASGDLCDPKTSTIGDCVKEINKRIKKLEEENQAQQEEIQALKLTNGLVAYYPFNGNANDVSGNGHHGTVKGATLTKDRLGNADSAYSFDGNDYIQFNTPVVHYIPPYSVSFRIKYDAVPSVNGYIISNGAQTGSQGFAFAVVGSSHVYCNQSYPKGTLFFIAGYQDSAVKTTVFAPMSLGQWHHVTGTWDGDRVALYIDGQLAQTDVCEGSSTFDSPNNMRIGAPSNKLSGYLSGQVDELRIYNRALTDVEIQSLYKQR